MWIEQSSMDSLRSVTVFISYCSLEGYMRMGVHTHTHMYTSMYTHTPRQLCTCIHKHTHTQKLMHALTSCTYRSWCIHSQNAHTCTLSLFLALTHTHTHTHLSPPPSHTHTDTQTHIHSLSLSLTHTHTHTHTHTYPPPPHTHTYTQTHIHSLSLSHTPRTHTSSPSCTPTPPPTFVLSCLHTHTHTSLTHTPLYCWCAHDEALLFVWQKCGYCRRYGASLACRSPRCPKKFHFPCASAGNCFQVWRNWSMTRKLGVGGRVGATQCSC